MSLIFDVTQRKKHIQTFHKHGKPVFQFFYNHAYDYVLFREVPQNMTEDDLKGFAGLMKLMRREKYAVFNLDDVEWKLNGLLNAVPCDGKPHDVTVDVMDEASNEMASINVTLTKRRGGKTWVKTLG